ncbi:hypothetical protein D5086_033791 [Populus alba]|uniref:Uncharacterized protein n=1 Tax=Populus alba TaxID=43335 RepID=A0ACC4AHW7_POPAL
MPTCDEQVCYLKMAWNLHGQQLFLESLEMEEKILELAEIGVIVVAGVKVDSILSSGCNGKWKSVRKIVMLPILHEQLASDSQSGMILNNRLLILS